MNRIPASGNAGALDGMPSAALGGTSGNHRAVTDGGGDPSESSTISPRGQSGVNGDTVSSRPSPAAAPVPSGPSSSGQAPSSPSPSWTVARNDRRPRTLKEITTIQLMTNFMIFASAVATCRKSPNPF